MIVRVTPKAAGSLVAQRVEILRIETGNKLYGRMCGNDLPIIFFYDDICGVELESTEKSEIEATLWFNDVCCYCLRNKQQHSDGCVMKKSIGVSLAYTAMRSK